MSHNARVDLALIVAGVTYAVSHTGPGFAILRDERSLPAGTTGELVITVDGVPDSLRVLLPEGATGGRGQRIKWEAA